MNYDRRQPTADRRTPALTPLACLRRGGGRQSVKQFMAE
jgi:hypothetical protein